MPVRGRAAVALAAVLGASPAADDLELPARGPAGANPGAGNRAPVEARNRLLGGQLVLRSTLRHGRLGLDLAARAGLSHGRTRQTIDERTDAPLTPGVTSPECVTLRADAESLATVFEPGVGARVRVHRRVSQQAGYPFLALHGLALAPVKRRLIDPAPITNVVNPGAGTEHDERLLARGVHLCPQPTLTARRA